jgi:hypothetical protein
MKRYLNVILISLIIVTAIVGFYVLYPKYQFVVRDDAVYKLNKITGEIVKISTPKHYASVDELVDSILNTPATPASDKLDKILDR